VGGRISAVALAPGRQQIRTDQTRSVTLWRGEVQVCGFTTRVAMADNRTAGVESAEVQGTSAGLFYTMLAAHGVVIPDDEVWSGDVRWRVVSVRDAVGIDQVIMKLLQ